MNTVKEQLHRVIEQLSEEEANIILKLTEQIHQKETSSALKQKRTIIKLPSNSSPIFQTVKPMLAAGPSASQLLIDDRR